MNPQFRQLCKRCSVGRGFGDNRPIVECDGNDDSIHCIENLREETRQNHNGVAVRAADIPVLVKFLLDNRDKNRIHICRYGNDCDSDDCAYYHPLENYARHPFDVNVELVPLNQVSSGKLSTGEIIVNKDFLLSNCANRQLFGVCKFGAGCTSGGKCTFIHITVTPKPHVMQATVSAILTAAQTAVVTAPTTSSAWNKPQTSAPILTEPQVESVVRTPASGKVILKAQFQELCEEIAKREENVQNLEEEVRRNKENVKMLMAAYQIKKALCLVQ